MQMALEKAGVVDEYGKENSSLKDSNGNSLTKEQQEYFKDSKVRDENGKLLVMYQGSAEDFTVFDRKNQVMQICMAGDFILALSISSGDKEKETKILGYYSANGKEIAKGSLTKEIKPAYVQMYINSPEKAYNLKRKLILDYDHNEETKEANKKLEADKKKLKK